MKQECAKCKQSTVYSECPNCGNEQYCPDCKTCNICGPIFMYDYVRRLGQWHIALSLGSSGKTLCGTPMLSPNRADYLPEDHREKCRECFRIAGKD